MYYHQSNSSRAAANFLVEAVGPIGNPMPLVFSGDRSPETVGQPILAAAAF
jgi:hypothetical protein